MKSTMIELICKNCGTQFSVYPSVARKGKKYCSQLCYDIARGRITEYIDNEDDSVNLILNGGNQTIIDKEDIEEVLKHKWCVRSEPDGTEYVLRTNRIVSAGVPYLLHRFVTRAPRGMLVDHINHNTLDNRKCNLRIVTSRQSAWNRRKSSDATKSKYIGVRHKKSVFSAIISAPFGRIYLRSYNNEEDAAMVYDAAARILRGEFAVTNFDTCEDWHVSIAATLIRNYINKLEVR
jgi:hypothetical protein